MDRDQSEGCKELLLLINHEHEHEACRMLVLVHHMLVFYSHLFLGVLLNRMLIG
jgi:hypothetical protein